MRLLLLVRAYQVNGHMKAKLDPLGLEEREVITEDPTPGLLRSKLILFELFSVSPSPLPSLR
ncbi:unnamed protein product [Brassica oleracea]